MNELTKEKIMTVKEVAEALGIAERTVQIAIKKLANVLALVKDCQRRNRRKTCLHRPMRISEF